MNTHGIVVLFGSGETQDSGRKIQRNVLFDLPRGQRVVILETPAGFQPNASLVASELADVFINSLSEFIADVAVIPARKKGTEMSPDNEALLKPLEYASYIVLGPGSPTYAANQLRDSKALVLMKKKWQEGATLVLSSAAAIASGEYVLPVYEIYKVGEDFYWIDGLNFFAEVGLPLSILTHWNNHDGGEKLDTSHCFMGAKRFEGIYELFPKEKPLMCIDEHTGIIFYFQKDMFQVRGKGHMCLLLENQTTVFEHGFYCISDMAKGIRTEVCQ